MIRFLFKAAWLGAKIALVIARIGWAFFGTIKLIFGKEIGAGYSGPAVTLCALDRDGSAGLIIGGTAGPRS